MIRGRHAVRWFRVVAIVFAVWLLRGSEGEGPEGVDVDLETARTLFPDARHRGRFHPDLKASLWRDDSRALGYVLRTSPESDAIVGYAGPNDVLVALNPAGRVTDVVLLRSRDTHDHVEEVRANDGFWHSFEGWMPGAGRNLDIDAVSGSTLTSLAIAEAVEARLSGRVRSLRFPEPLQLEEVREIFTEAVSMDPAGGELEVRDAERRLLGYALVTSPQGDGAVGYRGPTEAFIGLRPDRSGLAGIRVRASYDTPEYVERVSRGETFLEDLALHSFPSPDSSDSGTFAIEGVSGATQTSYGLAEAVRLRLADVPAIERPNRLRDLALAMIVLCALGMSFGRGRANRRLRLGWQVVLVAGLGLSLGELISLGRLAGWARHGVELERAPGVCFLVGVALLVPWGTGRQVYCQALCPHGALQEWVGRVRRFRVHVPRGLHRALVLVPGTLLAVAFLIALAVPAFDLARLEAFDTWVLGAGALASLVLAVLGLAACFATPMAYCRFACPTGALLSFVRARGTTEGFRRRDIVALAVLLLGGWIAFDGRPRARVEPPERVAGRAFGTDWSLKLRRDVHLEDELERKLHDELERIEATCSSWRANSELAQFNASETTLPVEPSAELFTLVQRALEWHAATDGAFDPTVGPLLDVWGVGPAGPREEEPTAEEIEALLEYVGAEKLVLDPQYGSMTKSDARVRLDLGSLLQGYAADRLAAILSDEGYGEYLIDVGGELVARGSWSVAIEDPGDPGRPLRSLTLTDAALATSGSYRMRHILSPRTGARLDAPWILCAVRAPSGLAADGWATALFASGARALPIAEKEGLEVLLVDRDGEVTAVGDL